MGTSGLILVAVGREDMKGGVANLWLGPAAGHSLPAGVIRNGYSPRVTESIIAVYLLGRDDRTSSSILTRSGGVACSAVPVYHPHSHLVSIPRFGLAQSHLGLSQSD